MRVRFYGNMKGDYLFADIPKESIGKILELKGNDVIRINEKLLINMSNIVYIKIEED